MQKFGEYYVYSDQETKETPADYKEYPERDLVNFPRIDRPMYPPKVRFGFIPETWFEAFHNKTGVSGPYVFGIVGINFLICKEIFVLNDSSVSLLPSILNVWCIHQLAKKPVAQMWEKYVHGHREEPMREWKETYYNKLISQAGEITDHFKNTQASGPMFFQAFRENYFMTMEAEYRRRLDEYKKSLKRKLDYFVDMEEAKRASQRRHIVDWVVQHVQDSITDQVQKATLTKCVSDLKLLSQKAHI